MSAAHSTRLWLAFAGVCALLAMTSSALLADQASAGSDVLKFVTQPSTTQAGGHPDLVTEFVLTTRPEDPDGGCCSDPKDVKVSIPAGMAITPSATPLCSSAQFATETCSPDSQVGFVQVYAFGPKSPYFYLALYNVVPRPGEPGAFAFQVPLFRLPQYLFAKPRTGGDFGLDIFSPSIVHFLPVSGVKVLTWGVPADPIHDPLRLLPGEAKDQEGISAQLCQADGKTPSTEDINTIRTLCNGKLGFNDHFPVPSNSPPEPLLRNPTTCGIPLTSRIEILSYDKDVTHGDTPFRRRPAATCSASTPVWRLNRPRPRRTRPRASTSS